MKKHSPRTLIAATAIACTLGLAAPATANVVADPVRYSADRAALSLNPIGTYETGIFDASAAEIVTHYPGAQRLLVVNAAEALVEVLDVKDPNQPTKLFNLVTEGVRSGDGSRIPAGAVVNSVAVRADGLGALAVEAPTKTDQGWLVFFDANGDGETLGAVRVGALPDMVTFTPRGDQAVVANEAEPAEDYSVDPEGSVSIVKLKHNRIEVPRQQDVKTAGFRSFEKNLPDGVRINGGREDATGVQPRYPVSENLEPEYVTVAKDGRTAYVSLQEANAVAEVNLKSAKVTRIIPLGTVDRLTTPMDVSDRDDAINIANWPVKGFHQPDAIASYTAKGKTYLVSANEGDARDWEGYSEEARVKDLGDGLPPICEDFDTMKRNADGSKMTVEQLQQDENLGRLKITLADGLSADGACYEELFTYGTRSMSIWTDKGTKVFDTAADFERITAEAVPEFFNSNHSESNFEGRSDDKGPEPEGVTLGEVDGRTYAFVGLERVGGVMVYDITSPVHSTFVTYVNNRDFSASVEDDPSTLGAAGDLGPEGLVFISAKDSPTGKPLLAVGNEVSGTTTMFSVDRVLKHRR
ncbi:choice-of-anchor I family protein [Arthrobacter sp. CAL618]|uniref:choice-of-anchor I family protein n=1 Tax=Arthrobacter sp. CAL618 TaxID=1055770 RepID=UPI00042333E8|nr:choice-of-anchor I family protein [Arthrobacter sp. CAL618]